MLDLEPAQDVSTYLPTSLATPVIDQPWMNLPVILKDGDETLELTAKFNDAGANRTFWTALTDRTEQLSPLLAQYQFDTIKAEYLKVLKLDSAIIPELLGSS